MLEFLKITLKGMVIGVANIIPGVSGGTMAVSMGIYDRLISCISNLFKQFKKSIKFLIPVFLGAGIAIGALSFLIPVLFEKFPMPTNLFFIGLILGGIPIVWKNVKGNKFKITYAIPFLIFFGIVAGTAFLGDVEGTAADLSFTLWNEIKLFLVGIIASATMIIPGISGSMMLLLLGYYNPVITAIKDFLSALAAFDVPGILTGVGILLPFGIGIVVGIFGIAKLIEFLFKKFPMYTYWGILGLLVASPVAVAMASPMGAITILNVCISIVTFVVGFVISMKLGE